MCMCTIIATVQAILPYKCSIMSGKATYINIIIVDCCFPESTVNIRFVDYTLLF